MLLYLLTSISLVGGFACHQATHKETCLVVISAFSVTLGFGLADLTDFEWWTDIERQIERLLQTRCLILNGRPWMVLNCKIAKWMCVVRLRLGGWGNEVWIGMEFYIHYTFENFFTWLFLWLTLPLKFEKLFLDKALQLMIEKINDFSDLWMFAVTIDGFQNLGNLFWLGLCQVI